ASIGTCRRPVKGLDQQSARVAKIAPPLSSTDGYRSTTVMPNQIIAKLAGFCVRSRVSTCRSIANAAFPSRSSLLPGQRPDAERLRHGR
ncbi:MAG TPA: hypothetical protein PL117_12225, partial [Accumulibacter sp.]|nr:hypothetical protein [Accumulibacter sp.]